MPDPTLLDRVKKRIETDLDDVELQDLIDEANAEIIDRYGPHADSGDPLEVTLDGRRTHLNIIRPIDAAQAVVIDEYVGETATTLAADDYRIRHGGRTLERLASGTNPRGQWGDRAELTYVPVNDGNQRQEVIIKLVQLAVEFEGVSQRKVGDHGQTHANFDREREKLLTSLQPRKGLLLA